MLAQIEAMVDRTNMGSFEGSVGKVYVVLELLD